MLYLLNAYSDGMQLLLRELIIDNALDPFDFFSDMRVSSLYL